MFSSVETHSADPYGSSFLLRLASTAGNFLFYKLTLYLWFPNTHPVCEQVLQAKTRALHETASTFTQENNEEMDVYLLLH